MVDTVAFQAALDANDGVVVLPEPASGSYLINAPLTVDNATTVAILGLGRSSRVLITYSGTGQMLNVESPDPADVTQSVTDVWLENISIDGANSTTPDGAINFNGAYRLTLNKVDVRRFAKSGAVAIKVYNAFNFAFMHSSCLSNSAGTGIEIGGSDEQVTNVLMHDFLIQRNAVGVDITSTIAGGGLSMRDGAIRANDSATAVRCTGKFVNMSYGPGLHVESETAIGAKTTTGFKFSGASLFCSVVRFDGIDFYNIKTLFDLDGSTGTLRNVTIDNIYARPCRDRLQAEQLRHALPHRSLQHRQRPIHDDLQRHQRRTRGAHLHPGIRFLCGRRGFPTLSHILRWPAQLLDSASSEIVAAMVGLPGHWSSFAVDALWANAGAGAGDVVLRLDQTTRGIAETLATPAPGAPVIATSAAQSVVTSTTLLSNGANTPNETVLLDVVRVGGDSADTLPNDIGLIGLTLRRVA